MLKLVNYEALAAAALCQNKIRFLHRKKTALWSILFIRGKPDISDTRMQRFFIGFAIKKSSRDGARLSTRKPAPFL